MRMVQEFARVLNEKLRVDMNNYADDVATGACKTFDEYQKLCGVIHGLALAERHLKDLLKTIEESED